MVVFATGAAGARHATLETRLTARLNEFGIGTLVMDLVSPEESDDRAVRSETGLLRRRLDAQIAWLDDQAGIDDLDRVLCGVDTGAAAAAELFAEGEDGARSMAVLNGRLDLATVSFADIQRPVLFFLDGDHAHLTEVNRTAYESLDVRGRHKHFLHTVNRDALSIVARWIDLQFAAPATAGTADPAADRQRGLW